MSSIFKKLLSREDRAPAAPPVPTPAEVVAAAMTERNAAAADLTELERHPMTSRLEGRAALRADERRKLDLSEGDVSADNTAARQMLDEQEARDGKFREDLTAARARHSVAVAELGRAEDAVMAERRYAKARLAEARVEVLFEEFYSAFVAVCEKKSELALEILRAQALGSSSMNPAIQRYTQLADEIRLRAHRTHWSPRGLFVDAGAGPAALVRKGEPWPPAEEDLTHGRSDEIRLVDVNAGHPSY